MPHGRPGPASSSPRPGRPGSAAARGARRSPSAPCRPAGRGVPAARWRTQRETGCGRRRRGGGRSARASRSRGGRGGSDPRQRAASRAERRWWPTGSEMREVEHGAVHGVVEAVAADVVRGLDQAREGHALGLQHERRQQVPLHAGGQRQRRGGGGAGCRDRSTGVGGDQVAGQEPEVLGRVTMSSVTRSTETPTTPVRSDPSMTGTQMRAPSVRWTTTGCWSTKARPVAVVADGLGDRYVGVGAAVRERFEGLLGEVDEVHHHVGAPEPGRQPAHHVGHRRRVARLDPPEHPSQRLVGHRAPNDSRVVKAARPWRGPSGARTGRLG